MGKQTVDEFKVDNVGLLASAAAFRIFLAVFPSLIAAVAIFSLVTQPSEMARVLTQARTVMPEQAFGFLENTLTRLVTEAAGGGVAVAGVLGGLWAAGSAAAVLIKALNAAYEVEESRGFVKQRLTALLLTGVLIVAIVSLVTLLVLGRYLQSWIVPDSLDGTAVEWLFAAARVIASIVLLMLLFAVVYWVGPNRNPRRFAWISPGATIAVLAWLALSGLFALYTRWFGNYGATYGSLAGAVVFMLWLQLTMTTLLAGAELNQVWERFLRRRRDPEPSGVNAVRGTVVHPD